MIGLALLVPLAAVGVAWRAPSSPAARAWVARLALVTAALWLVALLADPGAALGRFGAGAAPAAVGTWVLVASISWPTRRLPVALSVVTAAVCAAGVALLAGRGDLSDAAGALAIAAALAMVAARSEGDRGVVPAALCVAGTAAIALGLVRLEDGTGGFEAGGGLLAVAGAALVVVGAGSRARRTGVVLLPAALVLGIQAGGALGGGDWLALVLAAAAVLLTGRPGASLGLWALAAAVIDPAAALLVGAAAVLNAAVPHPIAPALALPGAAALALTVARDGSPGRLALAGLAAATLARLWPTDEHDVIGGRLGGATVATLLLGGWLLLAPETWGWAAADLASWGTGVVIAAVAGAVGAFVAASFTESPFRFPDLEVADPAYPPGDPRWAWPGALVALALLAVSCGVLVAAVAS